MQLRALVEASARLVAADLARAGVDDDPYARALAIVALVAPDMASDVELARHGVSRNAVDRAFLDIADRATIMGNRLWA